MQLNTNRNASSGSETGSNGAAESYAITRTLQWNKIDDWHLQRHIVGDHVIDRLNSGTILMPHMPLIPSDTRMLFRC
jgi:hypothetical protein